MTRIRKLIGAALVLSLFASTAQAQQTQGTLIGFATLPARATMPLPADLPDAFRITGKFTAPPSALRLHYNQGQSKGRPTNAFLPMLGQPLQGFSDLQWIGRNQAWALTDNGFGAKANSADAVLSLTLFDFDFAKGQARPVRTVLLRDPEHKMPYALANSQGNAPRYLSGADLDPESFRIVDQSIWIGDEFGPYLVQADLDGVIRSVYPVLRNGQRICSPDSATSEPCALNIPRSRGIESMAVSPDGRYLLALLERPVATDDAGLTVLQFDLQTRQWTPSVWMYPLTEPGNSVGAMTALPNGDLLVIERDDLEGTAAYPCNDVSALNCFAEPAKFKRLVRARLNPDGSMSRVGWLDLLSMRNPKRLGGFGDTYSMPFWTIEAVTVVGKNSVLIANDNNFPFSASRHPNRQDDNEFALIDTGMLLH